MTLRKIAKLTGVSHTTVSLVVNNVRNSRVSQTTRARVLETIRELDYRPNIIAQRLALRKTNCIGVFIPFISPIFRNYTLIEMVGGIQDVLNDKALDLVLFSSGRELWKARRIDEILKQNSVDGMIIINTRFTTNYFINKVIKYIREINSNSVLLGYFWGKEEINYVGIDYEGDIFKSISYLLDLGHEAIALITGLPKALVTNKIIRGYKKAYESRQIKVQEELIVNADYDSQMAYEVTKRVIQENPSLTAIFVADYEMAFSSLNAVKGLGLNVPKDISIISYIDHEIFPFLDPPLTALRLPYYEMGKKAAELILDSNSEKKRVLFDTELIVRGSTAGRVNPRLGTYKEV
jgi:DNA-binding LacI/PurR family transcriptional regulator